MATQQKTTIVIEGDSTKATEALDKVNKAVDKVKDNVKELGKEFDKLEPAVNSIRNAATGLNQSATQVRQATAEFRNLDNTARSATASLGSMGRSATSSSSSLGNAGRSATQMATGMHSASSATDILTKQLNHLNLAIAGSSSALGAFRNLMGTLGISIGAGQIAQYMDSWVNLSARLKLATTGTLELKTAQDAVINIAKESRMSLIDLGDLYYKVGSSAKEMGISQQQVIGHVKAVANAILISGSSAESAKAALVQYSQAFASNRFGGDELRSVAEQAPRLFKALREGLVLANGDIGATAAQMKQLAAEGFITSEKMNTAMANSAKKLAEEAKAMPITIGQAFTLLNNELTRFIGSEGQTSGAFTAIVNSILGISNNVDKLVQTMVIGTGAWLSYKAAIMATSAAEMASTGISTLRDSRTTASALARYQATAAEVANTEAQLANAIAAERIAISQTERLAASGLLTNAILANTAAVEANAIAQASYATATVASTGATSRLAIAFDTLTLGMMRNPFVALLVVLGSLATWLYTIRDSLTEVDGKIVSVGAIWQATWEAAKQKVSDVKDFIANLIPDAVVNSWKTAIETLGNLFSATKKFIFGESSNEPSAITKRAMEIDAKDKADAEAKAKKEIEDSKQLAVLKSTGFQDWVSESEAKTKSLPTERNYNRQIEEIRKKEIEGLDLFNKEQMRLIDEMKNYRDANDPKYDELIAKDEQRIENNKQKYMDAYLALEDEKTQLQDKVKTILSESTGNSKKRREYEAVFRDNMTRDIETMINEQSHLRGIESSAVKALIAVESGFKQNAVSKTGAKTMFQFFNPAAQSVGTTVSDMLKSEALTVEKGTQYFAKMLDDSHGQVIEAVARYHDGTGAITAMIKKNNGKFDLSMVSEEGQKEIQNFKIALAAQNSSVTEIGKAMRENYKEQEAAAKQQENAIKAIAKRGSPEEDVLIKSQQEVNEYAKTLNADAKLVEEANARIAASWQKLADKKLDPFRDYIATAKELNAALQSGDLTKLQFEQKIAEAKGALANSTSETDVPVAKQQDVIDATKAVKDQEKATSEMKKFNDEMDKSTAAFNSFGNSGKMAFDGILGGISAVAAAASSFGADLTKLNAMQTESQKNYDAAMKQVGATEADKANATAKYNKDKMAYEQAMIETEISGARSIAGATSKMFGEKSAARKAFHGIEMGLAVIEMAMSLKKTAVNVAEGASKMFAQLGPWGFAAVAGMLAVMAGLGIAAGSSGKTTDLTMPESKTTGSVLGDNEKASTSFKSINDTLNSIHASEYVELKEMNSNFKNLVQMTTTGTAQALRERGAFSFSTNGMKNSNTGASEKQFMMGLGTTAVSAGLAAAGTGVGLTTTVLAGAINASVALTGATSAVTSALVGTSAALMSGGLAAAAAMGGIGLLVGGAIYGLSKLLGIGKVKFEAVGGGITSNAQEYILKGAEEAAKEITVFDYSKIKKTVKGWFSNDVTYYDVINRVDEPITKLFTGIYHKVKLGLIDAANIFGEGDLFNINIILPKMKLALKKGEKYNAENQKKIEDYLNKSSDDMATQAFGRYLSQFQELGEGMSESVQRLAQQAVVAKVGFEKLGSTVKLSGLGLITFSDSLAKAFGGLKELQAGLNNLYDSFTSETQKLIDARDAVDKLMASLKIPTGTETPTTIKSDADVLQIVAYVKENSVLASSVLGELKKFLNPKPDETGIQSRINSLAKTLPKDDAAFLKQYSPSEITTDVLKRALEGTKYSIAGEVEGTKAVSSKYTNLLNYAAKNANFLASMSEFNAAKFDNVLLENLKKLGVDALPDTIEGIVKLVGVLDEYQKANNDNINNINDNTKSIKMVTSANEKLADSFKKASANLIDFKKSISDWSNGLKVTSLGSTQSQLVAAGKQFDALMLRIKAPTSTTDLNLAMGKITGAADAYMNAITNFYGSSKVGVDLQQGVIDMVSALPDTLTVQELMLGELTKITANTGYLPNFNGTLSSNNDAILTQLAADIKKAADIAATAPTLVNETLLNAKATVMLQLDRVSVGATSADAEFLNALVASVGGKTGLSATIDAVINSKVNTASKDAALQSLTTAFSALSAQVNDVKLNPTAANIASLNANIKSFGALTAEVNASVTDVKADKTLIQTRLQSAVDATNGFTASLTGINLSQDTINKANASISSAIKPDAVTLALNISQTQDTKDAVNAVNSLKATNNSIVKINVDMGVSNAVDNVKTLTTELTKAAVESSKISINVGAGGGSGSSGSSGGGSNVSVTGLGNLVNSTTATNPFSYLASSPTSTSEQSISYASKIADKSLYSGASVADQAAYDTYIKKALAPKTELQLLQLGIARDSSLWSRVMEEKEKINETNADILNLKAVALTASQVLAIKNKLKTSIRYAASYVDIDTLAPTNIPSIDKFVNLGMNTMTYPMSSAETDAKYIRDYLTTDQSNALGKSLSFLKGFNLMRPDLDIGVNLNDFPSFAINMSDYGAGMNLAKNPAYTDASKMTQVAMKSKTVNDFYLSADGQKIMEAYNKLQGYNLAHTGGSWTNINDITNTDYTEKPFATGGVFTNGIVTEPMNFNMGLMGEAGSEAIMPLVNTNGGLGIRAVVPANDSGNSAEELAEMKMQNKILIAQNQILQEGFKQLIAENQVQNQSLRSIKQTSKEQAYA